MADAEGAIIGEITHSEPDSDTQDDVKQQSFIGKNTSGTKEGKTLDLLSEALSKMDESGQEDEINFSAAEEETDANADGAAGSGLLDDHGDKQQESETVIPEAEPGDGFPVVGDQNQMLIADSTSSNDNGLIDESIESQAGDCLTGQIDSESSKIDTDSSALSHVSGDHDSAMSSSSNNVLSDIAASSLLGSIATMIDSGSDCSLTDNSKNKDALNILETVSASSAVGTTPTCSGIALTTSSTGVGLAAPAASPISLNLARSAQNTSLLVNGNSLLTGSTSSNIGLGTSLLNTPGLIQAISQQQTAPITSVPTLRVAPTTPSPVTITVRTPPGTGALSQTLISNIVNTPEVQALLAKNPGQPITIVRVPDAPATVTTQSSTPVPAPAPPSAAPASTPTKAPAIATVPASTTPPVSAAILSPSQTQGSTIPMMKVVTNVTNKQQTPVRTFPPGTVLSNRLSSNSTPPTTKTASLPASTLVKSSPSPKPAIVLGVKKKVGRGGGKAAAKGMAPAVPSSQDLHLMRQKRPANCKTRSGRVSRPPLYRIKEYKTMSNEEMGDQPGSSDGEYSDYDDGENAPSTLSFYDQKRRYKCQNCEKRYIGKGGLARHYRENRTHGDPDSVFARTEDEYSQMDMETDDRQSDKETNEEETPSDAAETLIESPEKSNGDQSPSPKAEDEKPSPSEQVSKDDEQVEPDKLKPAIIVHYAPKPRGRGRGRPPGSGRKVIDQSGDASVMTSNSKDVPKAEASTSKFYDPKSSSIDDDLIKVTLPMLSKVITPWEYIIARAQQTTIKDAIFPTILKSLKEMHLEARKMAASCLERVPVFSVKDHSLKGSATQEILIEDDAMAKVLGVETGRYRFKDPSDDTLPKTVRLLKKQEALSKDKEQKQPKAAKSVGEALQRKRRMASSLKSEPPSKKTPGTISILSPRSSYSRLTTPSSFPAKRVHTIGTIASIADVPNANTTVKPAAEKRPIPPLGPISSASKGLESNTKAFESSPTAKATSVTTTLPPLKPIRTKPTNAQSTSSQKPTNAQSTSSQVSNTTTDSTTSTTTPSSGQSITAIEDNSAKESSSLSSDTQLLPSTQTSSSDVNDPAKAQEAEASETGTSLMETVDTPSEDLVEQTTVLPEGTTIMQLEDGTFLLQKPDGTAMQIQTPEGMTIETVQALLSMEGGAIETVEEPSPQYILDDGSCVQLPAGMSLDMAVEMGLINQSSD